MDDISGKPGIEMWPIGQLRPYERNSHRHSPEQIEQIAASIREWGWTMPILAADNGMVLAGHGRLAAGKLLVLPRCPHRGARLRSAPMSLRIIAMPRYRPITAAQRNDAMCQQRTSGEVH